MTTKTFTMKMALASPEDLEVAYDLLGLIGNIERDYYPDDEDDDGDAPTFIDVDDPEHLKLVYTKLKALIDRRGSGALHRVVGGFATVCYEKNEILDLTSDHVQLHPRLRQLAEPFQSRVQPWMLDCFGAEIARDSQERNHRFFEEAGELVQACGMTREEAHALVDYTWSRPIGEKVQEAGGVMVTLAALCLANDLDMHAAGETELARISDPATMERIRAKQASKPKHSPLPVATGQLDEAASRATMTTDLITRLREHQSGGVSTEGTMRMCGDAADALESLQIQNARLLSLDAAQSTQMRMIAEQRNAAQERVRELEGRIGLPAKNAVLTYKNQPENVGAWRLGEACTRAAAAPAGDWIDRGLGLLKELLEKGYGVVSLTPTPSAARGAVEQLPLDSVSPIVDAWIRERGTSMDGAAYYAAVQLAAFVAAHTAPTPTGQQALSDDTLRTLVHQIAGIKLNHAENIDRAISILRNPILATAAPATADARDQWQPIETAPHTGRTLLLGYHNVAGKWRTVRGQWISQAEIDEYWEEPEDGEPGWYETSVEAEDPPSCWPITPTHWMPLPAAPAVQRSGA